jgi:flagellar protein FliS
MTYMTQAYQRYKEQGVMTANPVELVVMLYDECIKQLRLGADSLENGKIEIANMRLKKAEDILAELMSSLDLRFDIGKELMRLYEFMLHEMVLANAQKDASKIGPIVTLLESLREAWAQVRKQQPARMSLE